VYFDRIHQNGFVSSPNQRKGQLSGRREQAPYLNFLRETDNKPKDFLESDCLF
jgi:hypothetical protein